MPDSGAPLLEFGLVVTLAVAAAALFAGQGVRRVAPLLARYNVPAPVIGGLAIAALAEALRRWRGVEVTFDATLRDPLSVAFFTSIGFSASVQLLRRGGVFVVALLGLAAAGAVVQAVVGATTASLLGQPPLLGVLCGTVTLAGGPSTGLAFAPDFEAAGVSGAAAIALTSAMLGILAAGLLGSPLGTLLIERGRRRGDQALGSPETPAADAMLSAQAEGARDLPWAVGIILVAMGLGSWLSGWLTDHSVKLPAYIGAMLVAAALRNLDDATGWLRLPHRTIGAVGETALVFFLTLALMTLDLGGIGRVAAPLATIVAVQLAVTAALCVWLVYVWMGRNYDAAIITSGFFGFMIGTTPVAIANMDALTRRYGPSPRAYLVVPLVGAFFIDLTNALVIQACLNFF